MSDEPLIHDPGNEARIETVYVFLSIDDEGRNGIVASILPGLGSTPLVTGSRATAHKMIPIAQEVARRTGKKVGLFMFERGARDEPLWLSE
jgi:hypothetical protein